MEYYCDKSLNSGKVKTEERQYLECLNISSLVDNQLAQLKIPIIDT